MDAIRKLLNVNSKICIESVSLFHTSLISNGRYGHRLVKMWEQKEYTTKPLKVYRTGGRMPLVTNDGRVVPGRKWTAKIGGGMNRVWHWVDTVRMTQEDIIKEHVFHERILKIIEDDNRTGYLALVGGPLKRRWVYATDEMQVGGLIKNSAIPEKIGVELKSGDAFPLKHIPTQTKVCAVEKFPGKGALIACASGASCTVLSHQEGNASVLQMPSGREILMSSNCVAVIGTISGVSIEIWGSAQQTRYYGIRPCSGLYQKKDGRHGRKIRKYKRPMIIATKVLKDEGTFTKE